jgi:pimeloyl-ACP methyl ester carboxylesterase
LARTIGQNAAVTTAPAGAWRWIYRTFGALALLLALAAGWQWNATRLGGLRFPPPGRTVDVGGRRLHLLCAGQGAPTVILEPSGLGVVLQYQAVMAALSPQQRVCAHDRAGQGWSEPSPDPVDARHQADDLARLLARAGEHPPYLLVASSAGGLTAELFAREHPHEVAGLVMVDALSAQVVRALPELRRLESMACQARDVAWFGLPRLIDPLRLNRLPEGERERVVWLTYSARTLTTACALTRNFDVSAAQIGQSPPLSAVVPVVVLTHDDPSDLVPGLDAAELPAVEARWQAAQREFAQQVHAPPVSMVRSGHLIATERPEAVVAAVRSLRTAQPLAPPAQR